MIKLKHLLNEIVTQSDLNNVESYLDRLFAAVGIDIEFSSHFVARVNDIRNRKQISVDELEDLFIKGRPSFTDLSTVINQNNTYSRPGGDLRDREARAIKFLIERQTT